MKIIKLVSIIVIIASVVALGAYAGKQMFRMLEEKSQAPVSPTDVKTVQAAPEATAPSSAPLATPADRAASAVATAQTPKAPQASAASPTKPLLGDEVAYALVKGVKVRFEPSLTSKEMMRVNQGTKGFVIEHQDGWTKIKWDFNKKIGWTRDDLLLIGPQEVLSTMVDNNGKLLSDQTVASATASAVASMTAARIQAATKKAQAIAQTVSSAVAKPAKPADTVKGYVAGGKLPEEGTITADPAAKIRIKPDTRAELLGKVPKGVAVKILSAKQVGKYMWFNISFNNGRKEGWTREDNLQF
ncbi:MAG TPA: SH3 domain-containing protein [Candidatus Ozemobacteraceae bacterium]|nr:SH3 domain-containing protein [Candidatus Ozemobacteraceae bacterium]